jgi:predicted transcriptional regulator
MEEIRKGEEDVRHGRVVEHEEARRRSLRKLRR